MRALAAALIVAVTAIGCSDDGSTPASPTTTAREETISAYSRRALVATDIAQGIYDDLSVAGAEGEATLRAYCDGALLRMPEIEEALSGPPDERLARLVERYLEAFTSGLGLCADGLIGAASEEIERSNAFLDQMVERFAELAS